MTITFTPEWDEWWAEAAKNSQQNPSEPFGSYCQVPKQLGKGYGQDIEVYPQLWLGIADCEYYDDVLYQGYEDCNHSLQFGVLLSGTVRDKFGGQIGEGYTLISGGGIQRKMTFWHSHQFLRSPLALAKQSLSCLIKANLLSSYIEFGQSLIEFGQSLIEFGQPLIEFGQPPRTFLACGAIAQK